MITIQEMLDLGILKGSAVLAGKKFLQKKMRGITSFDSPDGYKWLREGEFVLTTGYPFVAHHQDLNKGLHRLLEALVSIGTPGLAIKLGRYITQLPEEILQFADQAEFPILSFPMDMAWSDAIVPIVTHINNKQRQELDLTYAIYEQFHRHLIEAGDLSQLAQLLYRVCQVPVTIYLKGEKTRIDVPAGVSHDRGVDDIFLRETFTRNKSEMTCYQNQHLIRWLHIRDQLEGGIILWNGKEALTSWKKVAIEQTAALISLEIERVKSVSAAYQKFRNELLATLVEGAKESKEVLNRRAEEVGWRLCDDYQAVVMDYRTKWNNEVDEWKEKRMVLDILQTELQCLFPHALIGLDRENRFLLLLPGKPDAPFHPERLKGFSPALEKINKGPFYIGSGRFYPNLSGISVSYQEAVKSITIALNANWPEDSNQLIRMKSFSDLTVERILFSDNPRKEAKQLSDECLQQVIKYDHEKNGQLLQTLKTFLENNCNYAAAADQLYIHKNTIKYRLQLIHELAGLNPEEGKDQLLFRIALSVRNVLS